MKGQLQEEISLAIQSIQTEEIYKGNSVTLETLAGGQLQKELKDITPKQTYLISIKGLKGGHSGIEIDKKRANSNLLMGRVLNALEKEKVNYDLISISGGLKNNAIPREAEAKINLDSNDEKQVVNIINNMFWYILAYRV